MALSAGKSLAGLPSEREALAVLHAAIDAGTELIDTADTYGLACGEMGHNERLVGKVLRERPGCRVTVATKGGVLHGDGSRRANGSAAAIGAACEASLQRLGLDAIPLYQLHGIDRTVPTSSWPGCGRRRNRDAP